MNCTLPLIRTICYQRISIAVMINADVNIGDTVTEKLEMKMTY